MKTLVKYLAQNTAVAPRKWLSFGLAWQMALYVCTLMTLFCSISALLIFTFPMTGGKLAAVLGFFLFTATFFTLLLAERIVMPIRDMTENVIGVVTGHFSQPKTVTVHNAELGKLSHALDHLTEHLAHNVNTIQKIKQTDSLTGLPNRDALKQCVEMASSRHISCALLQLDVARLARINEALGSEVGDQTLVHTAHRLTRIVRNRLATEKNRLLQNPSPEDSRIESILLGRLGGDQFGIVVFGDIDDALAHDLSRSLVGAFVEPFQIEGHIFSLSCRIGLAVAKKDETYDFAMLLNTTAISLAEAKRMGRAIHKSELTDVRGKAYKELIVEQELRQALKKGELQVFYQPQVDLPDGRILGAEALIRWMHPVRGLLAPVHFIDLAEEAGLLNHIGDYVLETICAQSVIWAKSGFHPKLSMNVSASHCQNENFARDILNIISRNNAQPDRIEIEITETVAMQDVDHTVYELAPLREAGIRLAVDDFGTGYSNLAALSRLPFDVLKIDRGFVMGCETDVMSRTMISTILRMAQNLGFGTVAEGVETEAQRLFLLEEGCSVGQGYLFGKPMPADIFTAHYIEAARKSARDLQNILEKEHEGRLQAASVAV